MDPIFTLEEKVLEEKNVVGDEDEGVEVEEDDDLIDDEEYYEFTMIPQCSTDEKKTGVTFKGDTIEYLAARDMLFDLFNKKGLQMSINNRKLRILDNAKNKPITRLISIESQPKKIVVVVVVVIGVVHIVVVVIPVIPVVDPRNIPLKFG